MSVRSVHLTLYVHALYGPYMSTRYEARLSDSTVTELDACAAHEDCTRARLIARAVHLWWYVRCKHPGALYVHSDTGDEQIDIS